MKLKEHEVNDFMNVADDIVDSEVFQLNKKYVQHQTSTCYEHCIRVAYYSYFISRKLKMIEFNDESLIKGALLHDLCLYDWHDKDDNEHKWHGYRHPAVAAENAEKYFGTTALEDKIIRSHMWPLTIRRVPTKREAVLVSLVDKCVAFAEAVHMPMKNAGIYC